MSEQAEAATTEPEGAETQTAEDPTAPLMAAFEEFRGEVGSRFDRLEQGKQEPETQDEPEDDDPLAGYDFAFEDRDYDAEGRLTGVAQMRGMQQMMRQIAAEQVDQVRAERADDRRAAEADALEQRYPKLADSKEQQKYVDLAVDEARRLGSPELAREPNFLEMVYLAAEAREQAGREVPAGQDPGVTLERGGGAPPAEQTQDDRGDAIVNSIQRRHHRVGGG